MAWPGCMVVALLLALSGFALATEDGGSEAGPDKTVTTKTVQEINLAPAVQILNNDDIDPTGAIESLSALGNDPSPFWDRSRGLNPHR
jgi:hypothetical protein